MPLRYQIVGIAYCRLIAPRRPTRSYKASCSHQKLSFRFIYLPVEALSIMHNNATKIALRFIPQKILLHSWQ
jgi:hypothetical protein